MNTATASIVAVICTLVGVVFGAGIGICILFIREKADRERKQPKKPGYPDEIDEMMKAGGFFGEDGHYYLRSETKETFK